MFRQRLRTKTGCEKCRKRRKKCDETRPICGACRRWKFKCVWPTSIQDTIAARQSRQRTVVEEPAKTLGNLIVPFQNQAQFTLVTDTGKLYSRFMWPQAASQFQNLDILATVAMQVPLVRSSMAAFTGYMLFTQTQDPRVLDAAVHNYQIAVQSLRRTSVKSTNDNHGLGVTLAATFLGLLEGLGTGDARFCVTHFSLVARISTEAFAPHEGDADFRTLYRIVLEDTLYNLACMSLLHQPGAALDKLIDWEQYRSAFDAGAHHQSVAVYKLSPHFGGNYEFYRIMLEVVCFSGSEHSASARAERVVGWLQQIHWLEERLKTYYLMVEPATAMLYKAKYQLHALALRIYCLKIRRPDIRPTDPAITVLVRSAESLFRTHILNEPHNPAIAWPLMVFLCASPAQKDFDFFKDCIEVMKHNFGQGHLKQLTSLVDAIAPLQSACSGVDDDFKNTLDILIGRMTIIV